MGRPVVIPMTRQQALRARLVCQGLGATRSRTVSGDVTQTVHGLITVAANHADHIIGLRSAATGRDVEDAIADADVVSVSVLRPRRRLVDAEDVRWLQELTSAHVERSLAPGLAELDLTPAVLGTSMYALADLLSDSNRMTAAEMAPSLAAHGLPHEGRAYRALLTVASLRGLICHVSGGYVLTDDLLPSQPHLDQDEALALLARRFYEGHGPSSLGDFARWSALPLSLARRGTEAASDELHHYDVDGLVHYGPRILVPLGSDATRLLTLNDEAVEPYPDLPFNGQQPSPQDADGIVLQGVDIVGSFRFTPDAADAITVTYGVAASSPPSARRRAQ